MLMLVGKMYELLSQYEHILELAFVGCLRGGPKYDVGFRNGIEKGIEKEGSMFMYACTID